VIGVDDETAANYLFLCNPYAQECFMDSWALDISGTLAAIIAWFLALISVGVQGYVFYTDLI
jgi:hypothetical protein